MCLGGENQVDLGYHIVMAEEEDRISNLPDDLIHRILSFLDTQQAVETSLLSRRWKLIWTSIPQLDLCSYKFPNLPKFAKFVKHVLSRRNNQTEVSAVSLEFRGSPTQFFVRSIANYAVSHYVKQLTISYLPERRNQLPLCLFSSYTLKHLTLKAEVYGCCWNAWTPNSAWDLPVLETLHLSHIRLGDDTFKCLDLFSKCVKLKTLKLHRFCMLGLEVFNISAPHLSNIMITDGWRFPKVFNVVAPQLEHLAISVSSTKYVISAPHLSSFSCEGSGAFQLSTKGFPSLNKVNLNLSLSKYDLGQDVPILLDLLPKVRNAQFLTLSVDIIETLSTRPDLLSHEPCPFDNLKFLKIDTAKVKDRKDQNVTMPTFVRNYLLDNSPSAIFVMELPEVPPVPPKKSRKQVREEAKARKKAKLEEQQKFQLQIEAYKKEKAALEEEIRLLHEKSKSKVKSHMSELQVQVEVGKPDYSMLRKLCYIRVFLDELKIEKFIPENDKVEMDAQYSSLHAEVKALFVSCVGTSQWARIEGMLQDAISSEQSTSLNILKRLDAIAAELPPAQSSSPVKDIPTSSSIASSSGSKADIQPVQNSLE